MAVRAGARAAQPPSEPNLRVYLPEVTAGQRLPVVVQLHGDGFYIFHLSWLMYHHFYTRLACVLPAVVVTVDSGGNLFHFIGTCVGEDREDSWAPLHVAGGIPLHPGLVCATRSKSELEPRPDSVFFILDMLDKFLAMAIPEQPTKDHPYMCPMGPNATPLESVPLPLLLVAIAEHDLIRDTNLEYCDALRSAGKDVEVLFKF
uniref:Alpha/beta hydrolase fold-3 domain-containing protein n=1 Tax=Oryza punctata TaxID=4537 RepID=A0A0E0L3M6_ORYPU